MSTAVSVDRLKQVLKLAARSPSGANGQPWSFDWDGRELQVYFDEDRTPRALDSNYRATWILAGTFAECLDVAAAANGLRASIQPNYPFKQGKPCFTVTFTESGAASTELAGALANRYTDRRPFAGGSIHAPIFQEIVRDVAKFPGTNLHLLDRHPTDLIEYIVEAEGLFRSWEYMHKEHWRFMRWSDEEAQRTRDGIHYKANGMTFGMSRIFKALGSNPGALAYAHDRGLLKPLEARTRGLLASAAGFVLASVKTTKMEQLVPVGRMMMHAWLKLQKAGYSVHPFINPTLYLYYRKADCMPEGMPFEYLKLFDQGNHILRREFGLPDDETPVVMWRTGLCPGPLPAEMWTLRRDVNDLLRVNGKLQSRT